MTALHALARGVDHPAPMRDRAPPLLVIAGLFAAPVAWAAQLLISYGLEGDACHAGADLQHAPFGPKAAVILVIGVIAVAGCIFALWSALRIWRLTWQEGPGDHHAGLSAGLGRTRFLGLSGLIAGSIFLIGSLFELLVPLLISPCASPFS